MSDFKPTPEQEAAIDFARNQEDNFALVARAGAAKTSTLVLLAEALPDTSILCLAFNKAIAEEMQERLPANCTSKTLHSLGYGVWAKFLGKRLRLDTKKCSNLLYELIREYPQDMQSELFDDIADIRQEISAAKQVGYLPSAHGTSKSLVGEGDWWMSRPMEVPREHQKLINAVLQRSIEQAYSGIIDFDDMIYCPGITSSCSWPRYPLTMVDEAQDLSPLNHHILKKLVRGQRLIAVGDPFQAIYGFRGADTKSLPNLIEKFDMEQLHLTVSFRCGSEIIKNAHWRAPDMKWPEWAIPGEVLRPNTWDVDDIQDGDAIICRNNAPLFSIALKLILSGRYPEIRGRDLIGPLLKLMEKLGEPETYTDAALTALEEWKEKQLKRARNGAEAQVHDRAAIIKLFLERNKTVGEAASEFRSILERSGRIYLMTGHKSKGLEFDNVWFLDQNLINKDYEQDLNLKYVIETRAKRKLSYVYSDMLEETV